MSGDLFPIVKTYAYGPRRDQVQNQRAKTGIYNKYPLTHAAYKLSIFELSSQLSRKKGSEKYKVSKSYY